MFYKSVLLVLLFGLLTLQTLFGQNSIPQGIGAPGEVIPTAPQNRIWDQVGILDADREKKEQISERLKVLYEKHDMPVYLVLYSSLISEEMGNYPRDVYDAWIGEENDGVVAVIEIDSQNVELAFPLRASDDAKKHSVATTRLPDYLLVQLRGALKTEVKDVEDRVAYVDRFSEVLTRELDAVLQGDGRSSATGQFILVTLLIGLVIGGLGYLCHRYTRDAEARLHEQYYLPDVEVEPRLGAPYGGARVNTITYRAQREAGATKDA